MKLEHINVKEAVRYMGMGNNKPDERTALLIDECEKELLKVIEPKFVYRVFDVAHKDNGVEVIGTPLFLGGNDICRHLEGCSKCVLFAATISSGVDRKLRAYEAEDMAKAMIADCLASAAVEQVCDFLLVMAICLSACREFFLTYSMRRNLSDLMQLKIIY